MPHATARFMSVIDKVKKNRTTIWTSKEEIVNPDTPTTCCDGIKVIFSEQTGRWELEDCFTVNSTYQTVTREKKTWIVKRNMWKYEWKDQAGVEGEEEEDARLKDDGKEENENEEEPPQRKQERNEERPEQLQPCTNYLGAVWKDPKRGCGNSWNSNWPYCRSLADLDKGKRNHLVWKTKQYRDVETRRRILEERLTAWYKVVYPFYLGNEEVLEGIKAFVRVEMEMQVEFHPPVKATTENIWGRSGRVTVTVISPSPSGETSEETGSASEA